MYFLLTCEYSLLRLYIVGARGTVLVEDPIIANPQFLDSSYWRRGNSQLRNCVVRELYFTIFWDRLQQEYHQDTIYKISTRLYWTRNLLRETLEMFWPWDVEVIAWYPWFVMADLAPGFFVGMLLSVVQTSQAVEVYFWDVLEYFWGRFRILFRSF